MTQTVTFHVLHHGLSLTDAVVQLIAERWENGQPSLLLTDETKQQEWQEHLWATPSRFIPSSLFDAETPPDWRAPVLIGQHLPAWPDASTDQPQHSWTVINVSQNRLQQSPTPIIEFVPSEPERRNAARARWKAYKEAGFHVASVS